MIHVDVWQGLEHQDFVASNSFEDLGCTACTITQELEAGSLVVLIQTQSPTPTFDSRINPVTADADQATLHAMTRETPQRRAIDA